jgi:CHAT domain-containing protein
MPAPEPIERIAFRIQQGELALESGRTLAKQQHLDEQYAEALLRTGIDLRLEDRELSLILLDLLWNALGSWDSPPAPRLRMRTGIEFIVTAALALHEIADGRLYRRALGMGTEILDQARTTNDAQLIARVTRVLGILNLDPYNHVMGDFVVEQQAWRRSIEKLPDRFSANPDELAMPEPKEAFQRAEDYLRIAVASTSGPLRGMNLKMLVQALVWRDQFVEPVSPAEILPLAREAIGLIDASQGRMFVEAVLEQYGGDAEPDDDRQDVSVDALVAQHGAVIARELINQAANAMEDDAAFALLLRARQLFEEGGTETDRTTRYAILLQKLPSLDPALPASLEQKSFVEARTIIGDEVVKSGASPRRHALELARFAFQTTGWNGETEGLLAAVAARELLEGADPSDLQDVLMYLLMVLARGAGANFYTASDYAQAMTAFGIALRPATELRLPSMTSEVLVRMGILLDLDDSLDLLSELTKALIGTAIPISLLGDPAASELLRRTLSHAIATAVRKPAPPILTAFLFQLAKGVTLRSILAVGYDRDALGMPAIEGLRSEIASRSAEIGDAGPERSSVDAYLMMSWVSDLEIKSGTTPHDQLLNLKRRFDRQIYAHLLSLAPTPIAPLIPPEALQQALADDAVFIDFYLGEDFSVIALVITQDQRIQTQFISHGLPIHNVVLGSSDEQQALASPLALTVEGIRQDVQRKPEELQSLEESLPAFFGHLAEALPHLHALGKRVLYIAPHGPLHYLPFHLLGGKTPLADSWTVVSVPNLGLAFRGMSPPQGGEVAALGITLGLKKVETEVRGIAEIAGAEPILDAAATRERLIAELRRCRFIHIATHGELEPNAAAFQTLNLTDGRFYAHEILPLRLDHVELVTLSACETALGRFDADDNLRGLAANLFLAGVHAVIGTLWPVEDHSAAWFFRTLYAELGTGTAVIDAYRIAQISTREQFPLYRDWGAFYLMRSPVDVAIPLG